VENGKEDRAAIQTTAVEASQLVEDERCWTKTVQDTDCHNASTSSLTHYSR